MDYWSRLRRFPRSHGFGLQSPFAYSFEFEIIRQKLPYYAYNKLNLERKELGDGIETDEQFEKLLFRLSNYVQPTTVLLPAEDWGMSSRYLSEGCRKATVQTYEDVFGLQNLIENLDRIDLLCLSCAGDFEQIFDKLYPCLSSKSMVVIKDVRSTHHEVEAWYRVIADKRVGITFDLYKVGLVFFDNCYAKQNYMVNFPSQ